MRHIMVARGLRLCAALIALAAGPAFGFDIEEEREFPAPEGQGGLQLSILSTTDTEFFAPLVQEFQRRNPAVAIRYTVASTQAVYQAVAVENAPFDLVISSAMDLQMKLANDGFALPHRSVETQSLPQWARWGDQLFAFAQESVVTVVARAAFAEGQIPRTRAELTEALRDAPDRFRGRVGTYDPRRSGAGYLFATQDARLSDTYWRLSEVMGSLGARLYDTTGAMIDDLESGTLVVGYNLLGSYAEAQIEPDGALAILALEDFTHVLLRSALVPRQATAPELGGAFVDFLLTESGQSLIRDATGLPPISEVEIAQNPSLRPIRLDPGLLVYVDPLKRQNFLNEWLAAVIQH